MKQRLSQVFDYQTPPSIHQLLWRGAGSSYIMRSEGMNDVCRLKEGVASVKTEKERYTQSETRASDLSP